jgi:hypothetical protein
MTPGNFGFTDDAARRAACQRAKEWLETRK